MIYNYKYRISYNNMNNNLKYKKWKIKITKQNYKIKIQKFKI